jgi:hypothetical protein
LRAAGGPTIHLPSRDGTFDVLLTGSLVRYGEALDGSTRIIPLDSDVASDLKMHPSIERW